MGSVRYGFLVFGLLAWPVMLAVMGGLLGFSLWLLLAVYLFGVGWELIVLFSVAFSSALAVARMTARLLRTARRHLVREHAQYAAGLCALISIGITAVSRFASVDRMQWGTAGLIWAAWAITVLVASRRPAV